MPRTVNIRVPASTSNLGAGFDTLGLALNLPLEVVVRYEVAEDRIISARGEGETEISKLGGHLVVQAFKDACRALQQPAPHIALEINNAIPLKRGLGSSAAAIVAGLLAAKLYFQDSLAQQLLLNLACELEGHPENASASLFGGLTVNGVENGQVICERFLPPENWSAACFVPDLEIATEDARRVLPKSLTRQEAVSNVQSAAMMVAAFARANPGPLAFAAKDYLHQPYRQALIPGFEAILAAARQSGGYCAFLSGSGSTLLAICECPRALEVSQAMARAAQQYGLLGRPMVLAFSPQGATWEEISA